LKESVIGLITRDTVDKFADAAADSTAAAVITRLLSSSAHPHHHLQISYDKH